MEEDTTAAADVSMHPRILSCEECVALRVPNYCEENVWHVLRLASERGLPVDDLFAVFISNPKRCIPFQRQKAATTEMNGVCLWDYHVIAIVLSNGLNDKRSAHVYDVDSTLPFPSTLANYVAQSIAKTLPNGMTYAQLDEYGFRHHFRVVKYSELLSLFSSDRRHMRASKEKWTDVCEPKYRSPPPTRPCITASDLSHPHSLPLFLKMSGTSEDDAFAVDEELREMRAPGILLEHVSDLLSLFNVDEGG